MAEPELELLSAEEVDRWADVIADELSKPNSDLRNLALTGLGEPDLMRWIAPRLPLPKLEPDSQLDYSTVPALLREVIFKGDRKELHELAKRVLSETPRTTFESFRKMLDPASLRKILLAQADKFKGKQGPRLGLAPKEYEDLVVRADSLYPVLLYALRELDRGTKHTLPELLEFLLVDHERAVTYLKRHVLGIDAALRHPKFLKNAKRIETRAKRLAEGLAGCDHGYALSTSAERVRQGRRSRRFAGPEETPLEK